MTTRDITDGAIVSGGLTMPVWVHAIEGWLQLGVIVLSIVLLLYSIRVRQLEIKAKSARGEEMDGEVSI